ncbi:MAG: hypothetical protein ACTSRS_06680 [Candidatus Helarchaeota archaeon]
MSWKYASIIVVFSILLVGVVFTQMSAAPPMKITGTPGDITTCGWETQADWHNGTDVSTSEVDITYSLDTNVKQGDDILYQNMFLNYKDKTYTQVGLQIAMSFNEGGLDVANKEVLDWTKVKGSSISMISDSFQNNRYIRTEFRFDGFRIVNGTAEDLQLGFGEDGESWDYYPENVLSTIQINDATYKIGDPILSTRDYSYNNQTLKESIVEFKVAMNATIGTETERCYIPILFTFQITHNITANLYKYGIDIDWSACKAFPTAIPLNSGDDFTLIANDLVTVGNGEWQMGHFTTDPENRTAFFIKDGEELGREYFTTQYQIKGNPIERNTTRIYIANASDTGDIYEEPYISYVFVCFDGFKYNQSTGLVFDPFVIIPCSEFNDMIPWTNLLLYVIGLVAVISIVHIFRKKSQLKLKVASVRL